MADNDLTREKQEWLASARALIDFLEAHPLLIRTGGTFATALELAGNCTRDFREAVVALAQAGDVTLTAARSNVNATVSFGPHTYTAFAPAREICEEREVVSREFVVPTVAELTGVWSEDE